jgi:sugar phosphate isomerase/epimerase
MEKNKSRRNFIQKSLIAGAGLSLIDPLAVFAAAKKPKMKLGLVTYLWGKDWDLPTLIANCEETGLLGVELRTHHAHGVETDLSKNERNDVKNGLPTVRLPVSGTVRTSNFTVPTRPLYVKTLKMQKPIFNCVKILAPPGLK